VLCLCFACVGNVLFVFCMNYVLCCFMIFFNLIINFTNYKLLVFIFLISPSPPTALPAFTVQHLSARVARRSEGPEVHTDFQTGVHTGVTDEVRVVCVCL
jgi:hypothetical protein